MVPLTEVNDDKEEEEEFSYKIQRHPSHAMLSDSNTPLHCIGYCACFSLTGNFDMFWNSHAARNCLAESQINIPIPPSNDA